MERLVRFTAAREVETVDVYADEAPDVFRVRNSAQERVTRVVLHYGGAP